MGILRRWVGEPSTINTRATVDDGTLNTRSYYLCFDFHAAVLGATLCGGFALPNLSCCDSPLLQKVSYTNRSINIDTAILCLSGDSILVECLKWFLPFHLRNFC